MSMLRGIRLTLKQLN